MTRRQIGEVAFGGDNNFDKSPINESKHRILVRRLCDPSWQLVADQRRSTRLWEKEPPHHVDNQNAGTTSRWAL